MLRIADTGVDGRMTCFANTGSGVAALLEVGDVGGSTQCAFVIQVAAGAGTVVAV
jgi:hypothetical protein